MPVNLFFEYNDIIPEQKHTRGFISFPIEFEMTEYHMTKYHFKTKCQGLFDYCLQLNIPIIQNCFKNWSPANNLAITALKFLVLPLKVKA